MESTIETAAERHTRCVVSKVSVADLLDLLLKARIVSRGVVAARLAGMCRLIAVRLTLLTVLETVHLEASVAKLLIIAAPPRPLVTLWADFRPCRWFDPNELPEIDRVAFGRELLRVLLCGVDSPAHILETDARTANCLQSSDSDLTDRSNASAIAAAAGSGIRSAALSVKDSSVR